MKDIIMKKSSLVILIFLVLLIPASAEQLTLPRQLTPTEQLTPEQKAEDNAIDALIEEINKRIPPETLITDKTLTSTGKLIEKLVVEAGYSGKGYRIRGNVSQGSIHYRVIIKPKTMPDNRFIIECIYYFKKHEVFNK